MDVTNERTYLWGTTEFATEIGGMQLHLDHSLQRKLVSHSCGSVTLVYPGRPQASFGIEVMGRKAAGTAAGRKRAVREEDCPCSAAVKGRDCYCTREVIMRPKWANGEFDGARFTVGPCQCQLGSDLSVEKVQQAAFKMFGRAQQLVSQAAKPK